jgi:hypothetical protein
MTGAIPLLPQYAFMAWCLVKHRDNFTFILNSLSLTSVSHYLMTLFQLHWLSPSNGVVTGNDVLIRIGKEVVVAYFKVTFITFVWREKLGFLASIRTQDLPVKKQEC